MIQKYLPMRQLFFSIMTLLVGSLFFSCQEEVQQEEKFYRPVKFQEVGYLNVEKIRTFSGTAQTDKTINLSFRNTGIITQYNMKLGQRVRKGKLLAKLDNVQARLAHEQAITQLNTAESQMNTAKLALNRVRVLFEKGSSSLSDFEAAKNAYKTAQEGFQSAKRGVAIQKERITYGYLYAPSTGTIAEVLAEVDENVAPGQPVAILDAGRNKEIALGIPEGVINGIKEGMMATGDFSSIPNKKYQAKVTEIAPSVNPRTATYPVRLTIKNPDDAIKSGMAANVSFNFGGVKTDNTTLVIPINAISEDIDGRFVFLVEGEGERGIIKKQHIEVGNLSSKGFEVKSGLTAGQKIITAGLHTLLDGQEVKL